MASALRLPPTQVIVLRALQARLLEALAKVHNGAAQLSILKRPERELVHQISAVGAQPSEDERERLLSGARQATRKCIESVVSVGTSASVTCSGKCCCQCWSHNAMWGLASIARHTHVTCPFVMAHVARSSGAVLARGKFAGIRRGGDEDAPSWPGNWLLIVSV